MFISEAKNKILANIRNLDNIKFCQESNILAKIIKYNRFFQLNLFFITSIIQYLMRLFLQNWKLQMWFQFKKKDQNNVERYCLGGTLANLSKVYETCNYDQVYKYFNQILSKWQFGFGKGFSTQQCLLVVTKKWTLDWSYMNRSFKVFDCILHDLLLTTSLSESGRVFFPIDVNKN